MANEPIILIPTRLAAQRLPNKPLADIHGEPMIVHVWRRAVAAALGPVVVACGDRAIAEAIDKVGGWAVMTDPALPTGSDRIHAALQTVDPTRRFDPVINLQGDLPTLEPTALRAVLDALDDPAVDIGTICCEIENEADALAPSIVKIALALEEGARIGRALYFSRAPIPYGSGPRWHHIGIYAYRRAALDRYIGLPQAPLEEMEKLEQLRALSAGMRIDATVVRTVPLGVDTPADLERARQLVSKVN